MPRSTSKSRKRKYQGNQWSQAKKIKGNKLTMVMQPTRRAKVQHQVQLQQVMPVLLHES